MSLLGDTGIINWISQPEYDLSWLKASNIHYQVEEGMEDLSLFRPEEDDRYDRLGLWLDDFRDKNRDDKEDRQFLESVEKGEIPSPALVWAGDNAGTEKREDLDSIYHTKDIPLIRDESRKWWICDDPQYTQAVIDKVKELNPEAFARWQAGASTY